MSRSSQVSPAAEQTTAIERTKTRKRLLIAWSNPIRFADEPLSISKEAGTSMLLAAALCSFEFLFRHAVRLYDFPLAGVVEFQGEKESLLRFRRAFITRSKDDRPARVLPAQQFQLITVL